MTGPKVVNVDMDGVVYDFVDAMRDAFDYRRDTFGNTTEWPNPDRWQIWDVWPITRQQFYDVLYAEIREGIMFRYGLEIEGAKAALEGLARRGWHIRIVTNKTFRDRKITETARASTLWWLSDHKIPYDTIAFTDGEVGKQGLRADMVIDDKPKLSAWAQPDSLNILFDQPWNQPPSLTESGENVVRAFGWHDLTATVDKVFGSDA